MVDVYDFPDGRLEVRWKGRSLPYSAFDKLQRVSHAAIAENKRLGEILAWIKETARPPTPLQPSSGWTATIEPEAGRSKEPRVANR
jgi:hypothetical protein